MSWKQNNGRNRGHRDGVGEFLRGPGSSNSGEGVIGNSTTIKGNKFAYFDQTVEGSMIVVGSEGASLALDATVAATNILLGPTGSINTTLLDGLGPTGSINTTLVDGLGPTGSINTTLVDGLGPTGSINTTLVDGLGPTGSINTSLKSIISGLTGIAGTVNIKGSTGLNIAQTSSGCLIVEGFTGPLALDATLLTTNTLLTDIKNQGVTGSSSTTIKGNQGINFAQDPTSGNMIVQGTVGITDTVPVSGTVAVSSVGGSVGVTGTVAVSSVTGTVTVSGTSTVTGSNGALALDSSIALLNWYLKPAMKALPANYDTWETPPGGTDPVPYYNTMIVNGVFDSGPGVFDFDGVSPFFQYGKTLGYIKASPDNTITTPYTVSYIPRMDGFSYYTSDTIRFDSPTFFTIEITIPDRYVGYNAGDYITSTVMLVKK